MIDNILRWISTSETWLARWLRDAKPRNPKIPKNIQELINKAEFDAAVYGINPETEYESIYKKLESRLNVTQI